MQLVILPGLDGDAALRAPLVAALGSDAVVLDYPRDMFLYDDMEREIAPRLPSDDCVLIAESYGGPLALRLAMGPYPRIKGLIFVVTFARPPRRVPGFLLNWLEHTGAPSRRLTDLVFRLSGGEAGSAAMQAMVDVAMALPPETIHGRLREVLTCDLTTQLASVDLPMAYVAAASDRLVPRRHARDFAAAGAQLMTVPGSHFLLEEEPVAGATALREALAALNLTPEAATSCG